MGNRSPSRNPNRSPSAGDAVVTSMNFFQAIAVIMEGGSVTRKIWDNSAIYCKKSEGFLSIVDARDMQLHPWTISTVDVEALDWFVVR